MTIDEILAAVHTLQMTPQQAKPLIDEQITLRVNRVSVAAHALQGLLSSGTKPPSKDALAQEALEWADCMVACAQGPQP
jgi:hypothetical protein